MLAVLGLSEDHGLVVLLLPSSEGEAYFSTASTSDVACLIDDVLFEVPTYAHPARFHVCVHEVFDMVGGMTPSGKVNRAVVPRLIERALG